MPDSKTAQVTFATLLLFASGVVAFAQQATASLQASRDSSSVTLKTQTRLTVENVTVVDAAGKTVHGLMQSDFTIKEDGNPQEIKNFEEFSTVQAEAPPNLPPNVYTNRRSATPSAVNILLFDNVTPINPKFFLADPMYERLHAIKYLKTLPSGTEVAILKEANGVSVVQGFTTDRNLLLTAIDSLKPEPALGAYAVPLPGLPPLPSSPGIPGALPPPIEAKAQVEQNCAVMNRMSELTLDALTGIASSVSGIKGRKNLIWFTPGIPWLTDYAHLSLGMQHCVHDFTAELQGAYGLLNAAQVAVYPVYGTPGSPTASMWAIADATGGAPYTGSNDVAALMGEAIADGSGGYYSLSYVPPPSKYDGKYHTVDVKVDRPGLHLRYRVGYTDIDFTKAPAEEAAGKDAPAPESEFHKTVDQGMIVATQLVFEIRVTRSTKPANPGDPPLPELLNQQLKRKQLVRYDLLYALPADEITLVDGPDGTRKGSIEFDAAVYGEDGVKLNVMREAMNFTLKPDEVANFVKTPIQVPLQIDMPKGAVTLHVGILDVASQKMGTLEIPETVAK